MKITGTPSPSGGGKEQAWPDGTDFDVIWTPINGEDVNTTLGPQGISAPASIHGPKPGKG